MIMIIIYIAIIIKLFIIYILILKKQCVVCFCCCVCLMFIFFFRSFLSDFALTTFFNTRRTTVNKTDPIVADANNTTAARCVRERESKREIAVCSCCMPRTQQERELPGGTYRRNNGE